LKVRPRLLVGHECDSDTHFRDTDDLLESGIHEVLRSVQGHPRSSSLPERIVAFSLPLLTHIAEHRRAAGPAMRRDGRLVMHERLAEVLTAAIAEELAAITFRRPVASHIPRDLLAAHVAAAFVRVLNWWVETDSSLTPTEVDGLFRSLVIPALAGAVYQGRTRRLSILNPSLAATASG
jgi:hypothetical protein